MIVRYFEEFARYSAIAFIASACSGSEVGGGSIGIGGNGSGGTSGSTSSITGGARATGGAVSSAGAHATGGASSAGNTGVAGSQATGATIVPLYSYPTDTSWPAIVAAKRAHPGVTVIAIANVDNGPGSSVDSAFTNGITSLVQAGIEAIGYVYTSYGARPAATVKADIDRWHRLYPNVSGIFFDEESNTNGGDGYYRDLSSYVKSLGMALTVANPGTDTSSAYINAVDVTFIYESAGLPGSTQLSTWRSKYDMQRVGVIPYASTLDTAWVTQARSAIRYMYITDDVLPNPWDTLPSYFSNLLGALE